MTHADEIYGIAATVFHGETRPLVERGLALGMYYHRRLYTDLLEEPHDASSPRLVPTSCKSTPRVRPLPRPCATGRLKRRRFLIT